MKGKKALLFKFVDGRDNIADIRRSSLDRAVNRVAPNVRPVQTHNRINHLSDIPFMEDSVLESSSSRSSRALGDRSISGSASSCFRASIRLPRKTTTPPRHVRTDSNPGEAATHAIPIRAATSETILTVTRIFLLSNAPLTRGPLAARRR